MAKSFDEINSKIKDGVVVVTAESQGSGGAKGFHRRLRRLTLLQRLFKCVPAAF